MLIELWCFPELSISCVFSAQMTVGAQVMSIFIFTHCGGAAAATVLNFPLFGAWAVVEIADGEKIMEMLPGYLLLSLPAPGVQLL